MIKFGIHPKIWEGEVKIWESVGKMSNYRVFLHIFWDILDKMQNNLGQECVKGGIHPSRANFEEMPLIFLEK